MKYRKNAFTLVELLAVIVILAVILIIAVPQIISVIDNAKKGSLVSSAKLIADAAEKDYINKSILQQINLEEEIDCSDVSKINNVDYSSCKVKYDSNGKAYVTIIGADKFSGLVVCNGTKESASTMEGNTCGTPTPAECFATKIIPSNYDIDYDRCYTVVTEDWGEDAEYASAYCRGDTAEFSNGISEYYQDLIDDSIITNVELNAVSITAYDRTCGIDVIIPSMIDGKPVTSISIAAFAFEAAPVIEDNLKITSVVIPNSVTTIGAFAFKNNKLTSVTIPNSITIIQDEVFSSNQLTSITIPNSVTSIGAWAFGHNQLTSVTIPSSFTSIGEGAFGYNQLTSIAIPASVTSIGEGAFEDNQLTSVTIPSSVTSIGAWAFHKCSNNSNISNPNLTIIKVANATQKAFDWTNITLSSSYDSSTGIITNKQGNITVSIAS